MSIILAPITGGVRCCTGLERRGGGGGEGAGGRRSEYTVKSSTSLQCHFILSRICVFSCNLPLSLLAQIPGIFTCYCGNPGRVWVVGVERIPKQKSAQTVDPG